ncbi:hypothetical protein NPIL_60981, partial [Nephila pilipes]
MSTLAVLQRPQQYLRKTSILRSRRSANPDTHFPPNVMIRELTLLLMMLLLCKDKKADMYAVAYDQGTDNPADNLTRGTFPSQLPSLESWWHGPKWLNHDSDAWPTKDFPSHPQPSVEVESRKIESRPIYVATTEPIIDISRYS